MRAVTVTSAITNNQRLAGQWFQIEDGLAYNWHRTYDPTIGRYTQADPLGFVDGPSVYGYAGRNPVMRVDPSGQFISYMRSLPSPMSCGPAPDFRPPLIQQAGMGGWIAKGGGYLLQGGKKLYRYFKPLKPNTQIGDKISKTLNKRGWTEDSLKKTIENPSKTQPTRDTRNNPETGTKNNDPATIYYDQSGKNYVIRSCCRFFGRLLKSHLPFAQIP